MNAQTPPEDLRSRTKRLAVAVIRFYATLPRTTLAQELGRQLLRSGTSVGANYREAYRGRSDAEFIAKMGDCLKELDETAYWLELLVEGEVGTMQRVESLLDETDQLIAIFVTIIKKKKGGK